MARLPCASARRRAGPAAGQRRRGPDDRATDVTESRGLRIVWTVEPQTRDFTAVCGHIFNDQRVSARNVGLLVQGVDGDRVVSRNIPNVAREIVGQSGCQFCGTVVRAPVYRVIVTGVDWDTNVGQ